MIRLPNTAGGRNTEHRTYVLLVDRIDHGAPSPFCLHGQFYQPGQELPQRLFHEPRVAVECAGPALAAKPSPRHRAYLYILWLFENGEWREIMRNESSTAEWADIFCPAIERFMDQLYPAQREAVRVAGLIEEAYERLPEAARPEFLSRVYDDLAFRLTEHRKTDESQSPPK